MRVLISGDRNWEPYYVVEAVLRELRLEYYELTILHGAARGVDTFAGLAAHEIGIPVEEYPADWAKNGRAAGIIRNRQMLDTRPDLVIAFHNNLLASRGTRHCVEEAKRRGIPVKLVTFSCTEYSESTPASATPA